MHGLHFNNIGDTKASKFSNALSTLKQSSTRRSVGFFYFAAVTANVEVSVSNHVPCHAVAIITNLDNLFCVLLTPRLVEWKLDFDPFSVSIPRIGNQFCNRRHGPTRIHLHAEMLNDVSSKREHKLFGFASRK